MRVYNESPQVNKWWKKNDGEQPNSCADLCRKCFAKWEGKRWDEPPSAWHKNGGLLLDGDGEPVGIIDGHSKNEHHPYEHDSECDSCGKRLTRHD